MIHCNEELLSATPTAEVNCYITMVTIILSDVAFTGSTIEAVMVNGNDVGYVPLKKEKGLEDDPSSISSLS